MKIPLHPLGWHVHTGIRGSNTLSSTAGSTSKFSTCLFSYWNLYFDCCFLKLDGRKIHATPLDPHPFPHWGSVSHSSWIRQSAGKKLRKLSPPPPPPPPSNPNHFTAAFFHRSLEKGHWSPLPATRDLAGATLLFLVSLWFGKLQLDLISCCEQSDLPSWPDPVNGYLVGVFYAIWLICA
jgi:hypothetical protein